MSDRPEAEPQEPARPARRVRPRRRRRESSALERHALSIAVVTIAVVVLGYVLSQIVSLGGRPSSPAAVATPAPTVAAAPTASQERVATAPVSAQPTTLAPTATPSPQGVKAEIRVLEPNYTVKPGDTLGKIAQQSGNSVDALQALNKLPDRGKLSVGQKLIVPEH